MRRGALLVFEGAEGVGKSTQLRRLAAWLEREKITARLVREPGGTPLGDEIRRLVLDTPGQMDPRAEALLFMALNGCANRDESVFADADKCLLDRAPNPHIAFGAGAHICLGRNLGRLEIEVLLKIALERMHGYRVAESFVPEYFVGESRGMKTLPATF